MKSILSLLIAVLVFTFQIETKADDFMFEMPSKKLIDIETKEIISSIDSIPEDIENRLLFNKEKGLIIKIPNELIESYTAKGYRVIGYYEDGVIFITYDFYELEKDKVEKSEKMNFYIGAGLAVVAFIMLLSAINLTSNGDTEVGFIFIGIGIALWFLSIYYF